MGDESLPHELRQEAQKALSTLEEHESDLERLWRERKHPHHPGNHPDAVKPYSRPKEGAKRASGESPHGPKAAAEIEETAGEVAAKGSGATSKVVVEAEEALVEGGVKACVRAGEK
ncbi:MAG: hypothetical protein ABI611_22315, partial [Solirubrobacteraceae bacterium]